MRRLWVVTMMIQRKARNLENRHVGQHSAELRREDWTKSSIAQVSGVVDGPLAFAEGPVSCNCNLSIFLFFDFDVHLPWALEVFTLCCCISLV